MYSVLHVVKILFSSTLVYIRFFFLSFSLPCYLFHFSFNLILVGHKCGNGYFQKCIGLTLHNYDRQFSCNYLCRLYYCRCCCCFIMLSTALVISALFCNVVSNDFCTFLRRKARTDCKNRLLLKISIVLG